MEVYVGGLSGKGFPSYNGGLRFRLNRIFRPRCVLRRATCFQAPEFVWFSEMVVWASQSMLSRSWLTSSVGM